MDTDLDSDESRFHLRARAELSLAYTPGDPPAHLFRHTPIYKRRIVQLAIVSFLTLLIGGGGVLSMRPPELVRAAIEHEYYERTLRGSFMDSKVMLSRLGFDQSMSVPGLPQLMRPCEIEGRLVYHLTTFFEKGGMVTVFAFDKPVDLKTGSGWWGNVYWQVVDSFEGKPLVLVSQQKKALVVATAGLGKKPG